jgi:hypothetical protein
MTIPVHLIGWFPEIKYDRSTPWADIHNAPGEAVVIQYMPERSKGKRKVPPYVVRHWWASEGNLIDVSSHVQLDEAEKAAAHYASTVRA